MLLIGVFLSILAVIAGWFAMRELTRSNAGARIPLFYGAPPRTPGRVLLVRGAAAGLAVLSTTLLARDIGYWSLLVIVVVLGIPTIPAMLHNKKVAAGTGDKS